MRRTYLLPLLLLPGLAFADSRGELAFNRACASCHVTVSSAAKAAARGTPTSNTKLRELNLAKLKKAKTAELLMAWLKSPQSVSPDTACDTRQLSDSEYASLVSYLATASEPPPPPSEERLRQNLEKQRTERLAAKQKRKAQQESSRPAQGNK